MFGGADEHPAAAPPAGWERLDRAAQAAAAALAEWRRRAAEAEDEVVRLRGALEQATRPPAEGEAPRAGGEAARLRAENALLRSRVDEARRRVAGLLARLATLEEGR